MELRHLRYFVMVAAEMHFGRAAQRLFVSQPALSQQIRSLEAELGFKLFERNRRGVHLTPEGATFLSEAEAVVQQADRAAEVARALAEGGAGHLRLSQLRTMPRGLPERVMAEFQRRHPGVEIIPESGSTEQNVDRLRTAQLVAAFVLAPIEDSTGIGCIEIAPEPIVVALPTGHPLSRRRRIRRRDLADLWSVCGRETPRRLLISSEQSGSMARTAASVVYSPHAGSRCSTFDRANRCGVAPWLA